LVKESKHNYNQESELPDDDWEDHFHQHDHELAPPDVEMCKKYLQLRHNLRAAVSAAKESMVDDPMGMATPPEGAPQPAPAEAGAAAEAPPPPDPAATAAAGEAPPAAAGEPEEKTEEQTAAEAKEAAAAAATKAEEAAHAMEVARAIQAQVAAAIEAATAAEQSAKEAAASKADAEKAAAFARRKSGIPDEPKSKKAKQAVLDSYISSVISTGDSGETGSGPGNGA
jgi:colicin import membrane protein